MAGYDSIGMVGLSHPLMMNRTKALCIVAIANVASPPAWTSLR